MAMYNNTIKRDPEDENYVTMKLHRRQVSSLLAAMHALKFRKVEDPTSARPHEPSTATLDELGELMSKATAVGSGIIDS